MSKSGSLNFVRVSSGSLRSIQGLLADGERIILATNRHWVVLVRALVWPVLLAVATLLAVVVNPGRFEKGQILAALLMALVSTVWITMTIYSWQKLIFVVTDQRVMRFGGLVNKIAARDQASLRYIADIDSVTKNDVYALLGVRTFDIQVANSHVLFDGAPDWIERPLWTAWTTSRNPQSHDTNEHVGEGFGSAMTPPFPN